jgi:hypothetical protein
LGIAREFRSLQHLSQLLPLVAIQAIIRQLKKNAKLGMEYAAKPGEPGLLEIEKGFVGNIHCFTSRTRHIAGRKEKERS